MSRRRLPLCLPNGITVAYARSSAGSIAAGFGFNCEPRKSSVADMPRSRRLRINFSAAVTISLPRAAGSNASASSFASTGRICSCIQVLPCSPFIRPFAYAFAEKAERLLRCVSGGGKRLDPRGAGNRVIDETQMAAASAGFGPAAQNSSAWLFRVKLGLRDSR